MYRAQFRSSRSIIVAIVSSFAPQAGCNQDEHDGPEPDHFGETGECQEQDGEWAEFDDWTATVNCPDALVFPNGTLAAHAIHMRPSAGQPEDTTQLMLMLGLIDERRAVIDPEVTADIAEENITWVCNDLNLAWEPQDEIDPNRIFCSGHAQTTVAALSGSIFFAGGDVNEQGGGTPVAHWFDPDPYPLGAWSRVADMNYDRWYPTVTALPDGRFLVTGGNATIPVGEPDPAPTQQPEETAEIYDPSTDTWTVTNDSPEPFAYYPFVFLLPDGKVLHAGAENASVSGNENFGMLFDPVTDEWTGDVFTSDIPGGSAVMYRPGKILKSGGGNTPSASTEFLDLSSKQSDYLDLDFADIGSAGNMSAARHFHHLIVLPSGDVLAVGGNTRGDGMGDAEAPGGGCVNTTPNNVPCDAVLTSELWDPTSKTWCDLVDNGGAPIEMSVERMYHSTALLLRDGRVLVMGNGENSSIDNQLNAEFLRPPYLLTGTPRPQVDLEETTRLGYESTLEIPITNGVNVISANLIRLGSTTHQNDMDQRFIPLSDDELGDSIVVWLPEDEMKHRANAIAPPGWYMLFVMSDEGVPSIAEYVEVGNFNTTTWTCLATSGLQPIETSCAAEAPGGVCPVASVRQNPVPIPNAGMFNGWFVTMPGGAVENPAAPTSSELDLVVTQCVAACSLEWANDASITPNCGSAGGFATPTLHAQDEFDSLNLVPLSQLAGVGLVNSTALDCQLDGSCCNHFDERVCPASPQRPSAAARAINRTAEYERALATSNSKVTITTNTGNYSRTLSGRGAHSLCAKGGAKCAWYLADLQASITSPFNVTAQCGGTSTTLNIAELSVKLMQPAFGVGVAANNSKALPKGVLLETRVRIGSDIVTEREATDSIVNVTASATSFSATGLTIPLEVPCNGTVTNVTAKIDLISGSALKGPPTPTITVPATVTCGVPRSLTATVSDPDSDFVAPLRWKVDGKLLAPGTTSITFTGTRVLEATARDSRGAAKTAKKTISCG